MRQGQEAPPKRRCPAIRCKNREVDETNARRLGELEGPGQTNPTEGWDACLKVGALVISMAKVESVPPGSRGVVDMLGATSVRVRFADALLDVWPVAGLMPLRLAWAPNGRGGFDPRVADL